jgi:DNA-binding XRE family transcriptional regulator
MRSARKKENERLREARIKAGLTIQELADRAGVQWAYVQAVEVGRLPGSLDAKGRLSNALGMSFKDLWPETYAETYALIEKGTK